MSLSKHTTLGILLPGDVFGVRSLSPPPPSVCILQTSSLNCCHSCVKLWLTYSTLRRL